MEVQIETRKLIKPSSPTPSHLRELKLSCFDQIAPSTYGSFILFFPAPINGGTLEKLETSLSEVLTKLYPFAGRLVDDRNVIDCNDQGVEYLEARVYNVGMNQFIMDELEAKSVNRLAPYPNEMDFTPNILSVQVNKFDCGGLAIGVSLSHKFADAFTIFTVVNAWATCCRTSLDAVKCLSFETGSVLPAAVFTVSQKVPVPEDNSETLITKRFFFSSSAMSTLKAKLAPLVADSSRLSRAQILIALIWKARIELAKMKHGSLRDSLQIFPFNFRGRTGLPIPTNAAGNLFRNVTVRFTANTVIHLDLLLHLVNSVGSEIRNAAESFARAETAEDLFSAATDSSRVIHEVLVKGNTDICLLTSCCRFSYYEADFGWGKPSWIASAHKAMEMVLLLDSGFNDGGIEAWVTLEPNNMARFEQDPDILAYSCKPSEFFTQVK
ncbi:hypothetical protein like AT3G26040 [Hibiscus trionum]|uniref:Uncharacterized protein n=1 Tax=Hibiscus trionum TaxID=183268 RepID=A0A9W7MS40_HIBTR|nr:hypothetical protein like AT3G26040 [Hibiscus trionum]